MVAAVPVVLATAAVVSAASAYGQIDTANKARSLQEQQIRQQQVQLRIQENQASIERMKKLREILATGEVMAGARGLSPSSSNVRAGFNLDFQNFEEDETASRLNYLGKLENLDLAREQVRQVRNAQVQGAVFGFLKDTVGIAMSAAGIPSRNLVDASAGSSQSTNPFKING